MLTEEQVAIVKGLLARGEKQHDIAAYFGCNAGRIAEVATGQTHENVAAAKPARLPARDEMAPWGVIIADARRALRSSLKAVNEALDKLEATEQWLRDSQGRSRGRRH